MATCKDCLGYQFCKANRTLDYSNYLGCVNVEGNCKLFVPASISADCISRSRLLRDPYFQEGRYPESPRLRMAIKEQPAVHVVPLKYIPFKYTPCKIPEVAAGAPVVTNADRLRTMDETQLVRFLDSVHWTAFESKGDVTKLKYPCDTISWRKWLQEPAEVDNGKT